MFLRNFSDYSFSSQWSRGLKKMYWAQNTTFSICFCEASMFPENEPSVLYIECIIIHL